MNGDLRLLIRKIIAVITATVLASFVPTCLSLATSDLGEGLFLSFLLIFYMWSFFAICIIGIPSFIVLRRFGIANIWSALILGFTSGALISVVVAGVKYVAILNLILLGVTGSGSAAVFWFTWVMFKPANEKALTNR